MVFAALAGLYSIVTTGQMTLRLALVLIAPTLEAALPLRRASSRPAGCTPRG